MSMKQVERKSLRNVVQDLKERLIDSEISSYQWILTGSMWVDAMTKEMEMHRNMRKLLMFGIFELRNKGINKVQCMGGKI